MGKGKKKYVIISGFTIGNNNRGCDALSIGSIQFMKERNFLHDGDKIIFFRFMNNFLIRDFWIDTKNIINVNGEKWTQIIYTVPKYEKILWDKFHIILPFTRFGRCIRKIACVAAINGGDGFSDIYREESMDRFNYFSYLAIEKKIPLILLPQTVGPFNSESSKKKAEYILRNATQVYVRDKSFANELDRMGIKYEITPDLSSFMLPEAWQIDVKGRAIGINVSGLAYSNTYQNLTGQFSVYPQLIDEIISFFQKKKHTIYLIPHSFNYEQSEPDNDDIEACKAAFENHENKNNIILINKNMAAPEVKFIISKMSFFIGTRMHANFAAIYTKVPVFGLSYSYKFKGAFDANGLDGETQTATINNITSEDIPYIINKISFFYDYRMNEE